MRTIVMVGRDSELLKIRKLLIEKEGYRVLTVAEPKQLFAVRGEVDLMVVCHTVAREDCELSRTIAGAQWPHAKELVLVAWNDEVACGDDADQFLTIEGPAKLVALVHTLISATPRQAA